MPPDHDSIQPHLLLGLILSGALLGGCEQLGIPDFTKSSATAEADGKAIGAPAVMPAGPSKIATTSTPAPRGLRFSRAGGR
jgi:hypothetical protein